MLRFLLLSALVACAPERTGVYDVTYGAPRGECAEMPAIVPGTMRFEPHEDGVAVVPFGELCPREGDGFACELEAFDGRYAMPGLDAEWVVDVDLSGAWTRPAQVDGRVTWSVGCVGADCAEVADLAPAPCEAEWAWSGRIGRGGWDVYCDGDNARWEYFEVDPLGEAPGDPVRVEAGGNLLVFTDGDDVPVRLAPLLVDALVDEEAELFTVAPELVASELRLLGWWQHAYAPAWAAHADECTLPTVPTWLETDAILQPIGTFGREPGFAPETIVGAWDIEPASLLASGHADLGGIAGGALAGLRLEVLAVADGEAEIRLVTPTYAGDGECVLLHDRAALSSTGELTWSTDRIEAAAEPAPLVLHAPRLRLGFDGSDRAAGGEISAIVDVRATVGRELDLCALGSTFGASCEPCPDDGEASCIPLAGFAWTGRHTDAPVGAELPMCGVDFTDTGVVPDVEIECEPSGGTCAVAWIALLVPVVRRRARDGAR